MKAQLPKRVSSLQLKELLGIRSDVTLSRYIKNGLIPHPHQNARSFNGYGRFWWGHEVIEFLERAAADNVKLDAVKTEMRSEALDRHAKFLTTL